MRIAVIGGGAIGSVLAATLALAGRDVLLVARGRRLAELQSGPLRIANGAVTEEAPVTVISSDAPLPGCDLAICCVKSHDCPAALAGLRGSLVAGGAVLTLQNGVEAPVIAARLLPGAAIVAGRMHGFFAMDGPVVRHVGVSPSIELGCVAGNAGQAEQALLGVFAGSRIAVTATADIHHALWEKLLLSAGLGGVAAALDIPAGSVVADPRGASLFLAAVREIASLASTYGVTLDDGDLHRVLEFARNFPRDATTSLQRDLAAGRVSEYDALTGAVLRMAQEQGVPHPVFVELDRAVRARWSIRRA